MGPLKAAILPDRGVVEVKGPEVRSFLQGLLTQSVEKLQDGEAAFSALLTPQGKFLFDFFVASHGDALLLECQADRAAELVKRLTFYKLRSKVEIADQSTMFSVVALWDGPAPILPEAVAFPDPRLDGLGTRALVPSETVDTLLAASGAEICDAPAYRAHRMALGVGAAGEDYFAGDAFPLEMNFDLLNGIDFHKGCFIGQEVTSRTKRRGSVRKRLVPVAFEGSSPDTGAAIREGDREVGSVTSIDGTRGLALLRLDAVAKAGLAAGDVPVRPLPPVWLADHLGETADD